jgi:hypothetical protein
LQARDVAPAREPGRARRKHEQQDRALARTPCRDRRGAAGPSGAHDWSSCPDVRVVVGRITKHEPLSFFLISNVRAFVVNVPLDY